MNDWLLLAALGALMLFVLLKGVRIFYNRPVAPATQEQCDSPDDEELVRHAKDLFLRVQRAWDERDLEILSALVTPGALEELEAQAAADAESLVTEIVYISVGIVSHQHGEGVENAEILFDVVLQEGNPSGSEGWSNLPGAADPVCRQSSPASCPALNGEADNEPVRVRELWHIVRFGGVWRVDAIQQVR